MSARYPFETLDVGGAFDVPLTPTSVHNLRMYAQRYGARLGRKFSVRTFAEEGVVEVSRVEMPVVVTPELHSARPVPAPARSRRDYSAEIDRIRAELDKL